jgi:peptide/nickel transport system substrate-binding protein
MKLYKKSIFTALLLLIFVMPIIGTSGATRNIKVAQTNDISNLNRADIVWNTGYWRTASDLKPWDPNPAFGIALMYETLFGYDSVHGEYIPVIGTDFEWNDDGSALTINLNPDAEWSDGEPLDAEDVVMSYKMAANQTKYKADLTSRIKSFTEVDDTTVKFTANTGYEFSNNILQAISYDIPIVPEHVFSEVRQEYMDSETGSLDAFNNDWFADDFKDEWKVCSGPYLPYYRSDTMSEEIYKYRDDWWGFGKIHTDLPNGNRKPPTYVGKREYSDNTAQDSAFLTGAVDCHSGYFKEIWKAMAKSEHINTYYGREMEGPYYLALSSLITIAPNHNKFPFNELWFRKVIAYSIDYDAIPGAASSGYWVRAKQGYIDNNSYAHKDAYDPECQEKYGISYDVDKAVEILKEHCNQGSDGKWRTKSGNVLLGNYEILTPSGWSDVGIATQLWAGYLSALNITTVKREVDFGASYIPRVANGDFDMVMQTAGRRLLQTPYMFLGSYRGTHLWNSNTSFWQNSTFNNLYRDLELTANDEEKANEILSDMQMILAREIPEIPTHANGFWYAFSDQYWEGWVSEENLYNQPATVFTVDECAVKTRLYLNLVPASGLGGSIPWFGLEIFILLGIAALIGTVGLKMKSKQK